MSESLKQSFGRTYPWDDEVLQVLQHMANHYPFAEDDIAGFEWSMQSAIADMQPHVDAPLSEHDIRRVMKEHDVCFVFTDAQIAKGNKQRGYKAPSLNLG